MISNGFRLEGKGLAAEFSNRRHGAATHANGEFQTPRVRRTVWLLVEHSVRVAQASFLEDYRICHWPGFMKCKAFCGPSMDTPHETSQHLGPASREQLIVEKRPDS